MASSATVSALDEALHSAGPEVLEQRIMELALARTGSSNGAIFLWDEEAQGLAVHFHFVDGVIINLPGVILHRRSDRPEGIAVWVHTNNRPYLCNDTTRDPNYAPYFQDVRSVLAVPIPYQGRAIGVISVSAHETHAFDQAQVAALEELATPAARHLRRAQLYWSRGPGQGRPFLVKGLSPAWLEVEQQIERVAPTPAPVLIHGESGTGKELVANAIHFNSRRSGRPFVVVNCAAIPETLLEASLFGHTKGAFTGASQARLGEFRKADGGTLFLDEIGDLPLGLQAKLLRAAESGEIQPLGSDAPPERVDVRLVCATHRDLADMVRRGTFRDDLYYRLSVVTLELPPLRRYKHNLEAMAQIFLLQAARRLDKPVERIAPEALGLLLAYDYPGNVRELKNAIEHAAIMAPGEEIGAAHLPRSLREPLLKPRQAPTPVAAELGSLRRMRERWLAPLERQYLLDLLQACGGDVRAVAKRAGVNHVTIYRLIKKRGIELRRRFD